MQTNFMNILVYPLFIFVFIFKSFLLLIILILNVMPFVEEVVQKPNLFESHVCIINTNSLEISQMS